MRVFLLHKNLSYSSTKFQAGCLGGSRFHTPKTRINTGVLAEAVSAMVYPKLTNRGHETDRK